MKKRGLRLALIGFILGTIVGLSIVLMQNYIASELHALLQKEVNASTGCDFAAESIDVSLIRLRAEAERPRIQCKDSAPLTFKSLVATFDISRLRDHLVFIDMLKLYEGIAQGVSPKSETYRFIDSLVAPIDPARDYPGRWKLKLKRLQIVSADATEKAGENLLEAKGLSLLVERTPDDFFNLMPSIEKLVMTNGKIGPERREIFNIGKLRGDVHVADEITVFRDVKVQRGESEIAFKGQSFPKKNGALEGSFEYKLAQDFEPAKKIISSVLAGSARASGILDEPELNGEIHNTTSPFSLRLGTLEIPEFKELTSSYTFSLADGRPNLRVKDFFMRGPAREVSLAEPLVLSNGKLAAVLRFSIEAFESGDMKVAGLDGSLGLSGNIDAPLLKFAASIDALKTSAIPLNGLTVSAEGSPKTFDFKIAHTPSALGSLDWSGRVSTDENGIISVEKSNFEAQNLSSEFFADVEEGAKKEFARFNAKATISGAIPDALTAQASLEIVPQNPLFKPISGELKLDTKKLEFAWADESKNITGKLDADLSGKNKSRLSATAQSDQATNTFLGKKCTAGKAALDYLFNLKDWSVGSGELVLDSVDVGCAPYEFKLTSAKKLPIEKGVILLSELQFKGFQTDIKFSGKAELAKGFDIKSNGSIDLAALSPLIPKVDELKGNLEGSFQLTGPFDSPEISGDARLFGGAFYLESSNVDLDNVQAKLHLKGKAINIESLVGDLNGGHIALLGTIYPFEITSSRLESKITDVVFYPADDLSMLISSEFTVVTSPTGDPFIQGDISINSAEFQKTFDVRQLLALITKFILSRSQPASTGEAASTIPKVNLDLHVEGSRDILIITPWLNAELRTDLIVQGTASEPNISGNIEVINGWLGLKNRKFEITSGIVNFKPGMAEPELALSAEANLQSQIGDSVLVVLEARGPVASPKVTLSSDRAYSERQLATLLTTGSTLSNETRSSIQAELDFSQSEGLFSNRDGGFTLQRLFSKLTELDSLTLEPSFNFLTGSVEPAIVARKRLFDRMTLEGESFFASREALARLQAVYALTNSVNVYGSVESISNRAEAALESGMVYTILSGRREFLDINFNGNKSLESEELERALRINSYSRISCQDAERLQANLNKYYQSQGYFDVVTSVTTEAEGKLCRAVNFEINEGEASLIHKVTFSGDALNSIPNVDALADIKKNQVASERIRLTKEEAMVSALRNEGYISSRVKAEYAKTADSSARDLVINVQLGDPVSFIFRGNTVFNERELLDSINLFTRKIPFGRNTINILVSNIERKYREAGYLYATISFSKESQPERTIYYINIIEEDRVAIKSVHFSGNSQVSESELRDMLRQRYPEQYLTILNPEVAYDEDLQSKSLIIRELYRDHGFSEAEVSFQIKPDESGKGVSIEYDIDEGSSARSDWLLFEGVPPGFTLPEKPQAPYTIAAANNYFDETISKLRESGYITASASSSFNTTDKRLNVTINPGPLTRIDAIEIVGNQKISDKVILANLTVRAGDAWDREKLNESKKKLLRLGLFSRITMQPSDGKLDNEQEILEVRLEERALQSLELGGGANSSYGAHVFAEATDKQLFRDGKSLSLITDLYYKPQDSEISQGAAGIIYTDPNFVIDNYVLTEDLRYQKFNNSTLEYDLDRISLASYISRTWEQKTAFSIGHTYLQDDLQDVTPGAIISELDSGTVDLSFISGQFSYDKRDAPLQPTTGYSFDLDYKLSSEAIASEANFAAIGGRFSWLQPFTDPGRGFAFALNTRTASAWAFGSTTEVPITQRYYLGGRNSIRGFRENSLGPRNEADDAIIGGDLLFANNFELRYLFTPYTEMHTFIDAGTVYLKDRAIAIDDMRYSTGIGLRFLSPIGPINFDIAHPLDERSGEPSLRFHFTVGSIF